MTRVVCRYHVLDGGLNPPREGVNFVGKLVTHCKVMGHSMVRCAKTAEPIDMPFWMKTLVSSCNHVLGGVHIHQGEGTIFGDCVGHSKALAIFAALIVAAGIIQLSIMSCSRRDHSVYQASADSILKISGRRQCGLSSAKGVVGFHSTGEV